MQSNDIFMCLAIMFHAALYQHTPLTAGWDARQIFNNKSLGKLEDGNSRVWRVARALQEKVPRLRDVGENHSRGNKEY